ncbi:hypothetical protein ACEWY4_021386 [Coilia grayii]|uniref:CWH43-like N-terminal domain-containing protein n=1 Tax=Coilia grayii TaxID=363190 RepID=A0ABD1JC68_9TELE
MVFWIIIPITLFSVSFFGSWTVYALALRNGHVCSLQNWEYRNSCQTNDSERCCTNNHIPTISCSGTTAPENSLFSATVNAGAFLFLVFCIFHHAHILGRNSNHSLLSKFALVFGCVASCGAFVAGNCNPVDLWLLHYLGAAISFVCLCFYCVLLTSLTNRCVLTGLERYLYPVRIISSSIQISVTILYCIFFAQEDYFFRHISAIFEWTLSVNVEVFELSFVVEFFFFSSSMIHTLLDKRDEEKQLILS